MHALIKKIDGMSKEIKEVETVCIVPQQAGSWTKKDNPVHFRQTAPLIFHHSEQKSDASPIHPPTYMV